MSCICRNEMLCCKSRHSDAISGKRVLQEPSRTDPNPACTLHLPRNILVDNQMGGSKQIILSWSCWPDVRRVCARGGGCWLRVLRVRPAFPAAHSQQEGGKSAARCVSDSFSLCFPHRKILIPLQFRVVFAPKAGMQARTCEFVTLKMPPLGHWKPFLETNYL